MTRSRGVLALGILLVIGWALVLRKIGDGDVYPYLGPYAALVIGIAIGAHFLDRGEPERFWVIRRGRRLSGARDIVVGVVVGAAMIGGTYGAFAIAAKLVPSLRGHVGALYAAAHTESFGAVLAWTTVAVVAEECLWRGMIYRAAERELGTRLAVVFSLGAYVAVQVGSGSIVLALAALVCGLFWTAERTLTRSLTASIVSHAAWTIVIIHVHPVTSY